MRGRRRQLDNRTQCPGALVTDDDRSGKEVMDMPGFDGSGPDFAGPMTGGARGWCPEGNGVYGPGPGFGRGRGFRQGGGGGRRSRRGTGRYGIRSMADADSDVCRRLEAQADVLQRRLDEINRRMAALKTEAAAPERSASVEDA